MSMQAEDTVRKLRLFSTIVWNVMKLVPSQITRYDNVVYVHDTKHFTHIRKSKLKAGCCSCPCGESMYMNYVPIVRPPDDTWVWRTWGKTCHSATLSTTNPTWTDQGSNAGPAVKGRKLTTWAMERPREDVVTRDQIGHPLPATTVLSCYALSKVRRCLRHNLCSQP
jgi:hypothetical protein